MDKRTMILDYIRVGRTEEHAITHFIRDEHGNKVILSQKPIALDIDLEIEHISNGIEPVSSEEDIL